MFLNVILAKCFNQVDNGQKETSMLPFQYYFFLFLRYCSFSARRLFCTDVPPPAGKMGAAAHRLGWSKPIQCDSVISLQYETNDLITVHLNQRVKDLCVYLCNLASSSRIPFTLKTEIFFLPFGLPSSRTRWKRLPKIHFQKALQRRDF